MPYPRLNGVLNNCALHALTPEIKQDVANYASKQGLPPLEYKRLKDVFAEFYGIDKTNFSWKNFADTLESCNSFETQLVLGPVLRQFMKVPVAENYRPGPNEDGSGLQGQIDWYTKLSQTHGAGVYNLISPTELQDYVATPLGKKITYATQNESKLVSPEQSTGDA